MATIFDGKRYVEKGLEELAGKVLSLQKKGIAPKLVVIQIGKNRASKIFLNEKKKAGERVGVEMQVISLSQSLSIKEIVKLIKKFNKDKKTCGIMVQLPLPKGYSKKDRQDIIESIKSKKDVDGMRDDSPFTAPVVRAVMMILSIAQPQDRDLCLVVGANGFVGKKIMRELRFMIQDSRMNCKLCGVDVGTKELDSKINKADILISATGQKGLITGDMVRPGAVVIDVGSPGGDVVADEVSKKVNFLSPAPGGVGPLTVAYLLENLVDSCNFGC